MNKYFLHLAYQGTRYQGWQRQANGLGIQEVVENNLSKMFGERIIVHGCGRTDAGVHASQYFCHTTIEKMWDFDAVFRINKMLPEDIRIYNFTPVPPKANAQLDVQSRTYEYRIHYYPNPFLSPLSTYYPIPIEGISKMEKAMKCLPNYRNFRSFCKQPDIHNHTFCNLSEAILTWDPSKRQLVIRLTANRFLKSMVRLIVGDLVSIGMGTQTMEDFKEKLGRARLSDRPIFAYPQGLYLAKVNYQKERIPTAIYEY